MAIILKNWLPSFSRLQGKGRSFEGRPRSWLTFNHQNIDIFLLATVIGLVLFGLLMVYSSSFIFAQERTGDGYVFIKKQILFAVLGFGVLYAALQIDYRLWSRWSYPLLGLTFLLLALVLVPGIGHKVGGAQRWIRLGPLGIQPAEIAKFVLVLFVARQLTLKEGRLHRFMAGVGSNFIFAIPAVVLLLAQPDFGSSVIVSFVILVLMYLAGVPRRYLLGLLAAGAVGVFALIVSSPYRMARLLSFLDPWKDPSGKGFQILQSMVGLHNGSIWGVGLGNGKGKLFYLPEAHNDFIFAVIGEELGLIGVILVVLAFLFLVYRGLRIAWRSYDLYGDRFGMFLATGITLLLGIQAFINVSVVLGLVPTKGLPLPFVSSGGSALMMNLFLIGVLLSVARGPLAGNRK